MGVGGNEWLDSDCFELFNALVRAESVSVENDAQIPAMAHVAFVHIK